MAKKYKNKYRVPSARWQQHDYGSDASYFVTICTKLRIYYFGDVETQNITSLQKNKMCFSHIGAIANEFWLKIPEHFPFVVLGAYQVMPNHVHGIITINKTVETQNIATDISETQNITSLPPDQHRFGPQSQNLSSILRGYKAGVTTYAVTNNIEFAWQERFHDRVIRNENEEARITNYILTNVANWHNDEHNLM